MDKKQIKARVDKEEDFINAPRFNNSIKIAMSKFESFSDKQIAQMLMLDDEKEVEQIFKSAIIKLKGILLK